MFLTAFVFIMSYFILFFMASIRLKNNSIVDFGWGLGFVLTNFYLIIIKGNISIGVGIVTLCITLWGGRLFLHIFKRNWGKPEDFRYATWRKEWGKWVIPRSFFQVFMLQGIIMFIIMLPVISIYQYETEPIGILMGTGICIWIIGFYFEVVGDYQLSQFKKNSLNKGKIMSTGLWRYTRHPNYFGEATMWWGLFIVGSSYGNPMWTIISPISITLLLLFVSGVPMLEKEMKHKDGYEEYAHKTALFVPFPPKKND
ncbi:DUF1295 domain-containing protein [Fusibacter sp. 3D3]|uniref:DUF1295 domain-containing protein n=1 Tax=Fusibacter sp. 3D3 TaxID=1048380 RepID=UPI0008553503|nr:DUF1295 domain-containing protein [Fusibacter sp. 3D3]GAU78102.1 hypothetical protein F3D3_2734 [Fusibacter sp. 3D3]